MGQSHYLRVNQCKYLRALPAEEADEGVQHSTPQTRSQRSEAPTADPRAGRSEWTQWRVDLEGAGPGV